LPNCTLSSPSHGRTTEELGELETRHRFNSGVETLIPGFIEVPRVGRTLFDARRMNDAEEANTLHTNHRECCDD
jgi:hypothetical protein